MDESAAISFIQLVSEWVEERYGKLAATFVVLGLIVLLFAILALVGWLILSAL